MASYVVTWKLGKKTIKSKLVTASTIDLVKRMYPDASKIERRNKKNWQTDSGSRQRGEKEEKGIMKAQVFLQARQVYLEAERANFKAKNACPKIEQSYIKAKQTYIEARKSYFGEGK